MQPPEHLRGIIAMLLAVALFSVMDAQLKLLAAHYGPMQVSFLRVRRHCRSCCCGPRGRLARLRSVNIRLHLLRGALSVLMLGSFVSAVRESSLATTYRSSCARRSWSPRFRRRCSASGWPVPVDRDRRRPRRACW